MAEPPAKRRPSGCAVAIFVVMGLVAVLVAGGGFALWRLAQSERGQEILGTVGDVATWAIASSAAPGAEALRESGCEEAMVTTWGELLAIMGALESAAGPASEELDAGDLPPATTVVGCTGAAFGWTPPACDAVARTYGAAVPDAPAAFLVQVSIDGRDAPECMGMYDATGNRSLEWRFE